MQDKIDGVQDGGAEVQELKEALKETQKQQQKSKPINTGKKINDVIGQNSGIAGILSQEDYDYFRKLGMHEVELIRAIATLEIQKSEAINNFKQLIIKQKDFEKQIYEKYQLDAGVNFKINPETREIIIDVRQK